MFTTDLDLRATEPGRWVLLAPLVWDEGTTGITVPAGFVTDLASVPRPFRNILNINGRSRRAAVLHDFVYTEQTLTRADCDALFRRALIAEGVSIAGRWIYWSGVRVGGWVTWGNKAPSTETA